MSLMAQFYQWLGRSPIVASFRHFEIVTEIGWTPLAEERATSYAVPWTKVIIKSNRIGSVHG